ncbi:MAG: tetratricopeptide repeat protein [Deltaproteobacteria bacterium]|nr:tetratricopeptide repeat protein [Deltaproteobacteria bacterium]
MKSRKHFLIILLTFAFCWAAPAAAQDGREGITQQYRKALEMNPDDMDARYLLGVSMLREKAYNEALQHLIKVYPHRSGEAEMNYNIGLAYAGAGELKKAFQHYMKADEINPAEARDKYRLDLAFYNLGIAYQKAGNLDEALRAYKEATRISPEQANAYCATGEVFYQKKDYNTALENLLICGQKNPDRKGVNRYISAIYQERGIDHLNRKDYADARKELDRAISSDQSNETAHYYMGYLEYLEGNYKKALSSLDKIKKTEREDMKKALTSMFHNVGGAMQKNEDWEGAVTAFSQAVEITGADPELRFFLGYSYMKAKKYDFARAAFKEALRLDPKHQGAAVNLVVVSEIALKAHLDAGADFIKKGSFDAALKEFNLALSIDPYNQKGTEGKEVSKKGVEKLVIQAIDKGNRFITEEKYIDAKRRFEAVLAVDPENQEAQEGIKRIAELLKEAKRKHTVAGEMAFSDGKYYAASVEYKKAIEYDQGDKGLSERLQETLSRLSGQLSSLLKEARGHENSGRFTEAILAYNKILDVQPDHKEALEGKSRMSENLEKIFDEALSNARRYAKAGDLQKAAENYRIVLELKPANDVALSELKAISGRLQRVVADRLADAASALRGGRYGEAVSNYKAVLIIDRENREAATGLQNATRLRNEAIEKRMAAGIKAYKDDIYSQAAAAFSEVLQIDPGNAEAQRLLRDARARMEESITPWLRAGIEAYKKGDMDVAIVSFKKVLNVDPGNREAREYLGKMDVQKTKASVAKEVEKHYLKGIELYTDGKYREAMDSWKKVLELDPKHEKALLNIEKAKRKMEGVMDTK